MLGLYSLCTQSQEGRLTQSVSIETSIRTFEASLDTKYRLSNEKYYLSNWTGLLYGDDHPLNMNYFVTQTFVNYSATSRLILSAGYEYKSNKLDGDISLLKVRVYYKIFK